jgi:hypothetical protein
MIYITFKGVEYEIPYDESTLTIEQAIDSTFDRGYFESIPLEASSGLDFSRRIPRDLLVRIEYEDKTWEFKTAETYIEKKTYVNPKYIHQVNLISLAKDLTFKTLENMTLQQPKGDLGQYTRSVNQVEDYQTTSSYVALSLFNTIETNTAKIEDTTIKEVMEYSLTLDFTAVNSNRTNNELLYVNIKFNGASIYEEDYTIPMATPKTFIGYNDSVTTQTITFKHTPSVVGTYTVEVKGYDVSGTPETILDKLSFAITSLEVISKPVTSYAQLVDKMLRNTKYVLTASSRSRLNLTAPEGKYEGYTLYDALSKIGSELRALVRVGDEVNQRMWLLTVSSTEDYTAESTYERNPYEYDVGTILKVGDKYYINIETSSKRREIVFEFFDNPSTFDVVGELYRSEQAELEDYVSGLELNTKNVVKPLRYSPYRGGWKGLRSLDGIGKVTTENICYETEDKIERLTNVLIKGYPSVGTTLTWSATDETDITDRVLEKKQWDTLPSESDYTYTGKQDYLKNNTLYYIQGDNKIYGMSYTGEHLSTMIGDANVNRSLYETILAVRSIEAGERVTYNGTTIDDPEIDGDLDIEMQITYSNITESRARVYKDDLSGFENERIKYMNESANINETQAIGSYAQQLVNRLGGTKINISGVVDSIDDIASIGDKDSLGRVYSTIKLWLGTKIAYEYMLVQDYNVISSYIGVNSRHRVEEISSEGTTNRTLRYQSKVIFKEETQTFSTRLIGYAKIFSMLSGGGNDGLTYGYLECNLSNGDTKKVHLSIDSDNKGKTIEIKWNMYNNYSAGLKRYSKTISGSDVWFNTEVQYTDYYGKVADIQFSLSFDSLNTYDKDLYPEATSDNGDDTFTVISDVIDKDGGEVLYGLLEIPILSENEKVRVYDGFARWNELVEGSESISTALLSYVPIKNATKIDLTRSNDVSVTTTVNYNNLNMVFTGSGQALAFYNVDTLDLLLVYADDLSGSNNITLPYVIEDDEFGSGINFVGLIEIVLNIEGSMTLGATSLVNLEANLTINADATEGQDEYEVTEMPLLDIKGSMTLGSTAIVDLQSALSINTDAIEGQDEYEETIFTLAIECNLQLGTSTSMSLNGNINTYVDAVEGQDEYGNLIITTAVVGNLVLGTSTNMSLYGNIDCLIDITDYAQVYDWGSTSKTTTTVEQDCIDAADLTNVKSYQSTSCSFSGSNVYFSSTDDTTSQPSCSDGAEYTVCTWQEFYGQYSCRDYTGVETTTTRYLECKLVNL